MGAKRRNINNINSVASYAVSYDYEFTSYYYDEQTKEKKLLIEIHSTLTLTVAVV